ncbi:Fanconi anemia core complex-associated protein 20 [Clarias gariepinus]|uniref:Fanconi anemia core complex-associated protein 20 n=1 Tax=Clarias gariepinus TaxID=13013 RepID=UPI00234E1609|nr:Fanconi anemia core complex-associated protein 20 [Clarias gariepinus]
MSKLKRRKTAVEEMKPELQVRVRDEQESLRDTDAVRTDGSPAPGGFSCCPADLSEVEKLWTETLQAVCPQARDSSPRLPQLPAKEEKRYERRWCGLDEDVPPVPDPPAPCAIPRTLPVSAPDPQVGAGSPTAHGAQNSPGHGDDPADVGVRERVTDRTSAGKSTSGSERSGPEREGETGAGMSGRGSGSDGVRLECCPMCLIPFPAGFSQIECDGHLAQCLSEMNVDMVW